MDWMDQRIHPRIRPWRCTSPPWDPAPGVRPGGCQHRLARHRTHPRPSAPPGRDFLARQARSTPATRHKRTSHRCFRTETSFYVKSPGAAGLTTVVTRTVTNLAGMLDGRAPSELATTIVVQ